LAGPPPGPSDCSRIARASSEQPAELPHSWELADFEPEEPGPREPFELDGPDAAELQSALPPASARVLSSAPLTLGIEAQEAEESRGEATEEFAGLAGATQAYRIGRVTLPAGLDTVVPACAKIVVVNDGQAPWPETAAVTLVAGEALDFDHLPLGPLQPGEAAEVVMDMLVPSKPVPCAQRSSWAILDTNGGKLLAETRRHCHAPLGSDEASTSKTLPAWGARAACGSGCGRSLLNNSTGLPLCSGLSVGPPTLSHWPADALLADAVAIDMTERHLHRAHGLQHPRERVGHAI